MTRAGPRERELVSVVVPVRNVEATVGDALGSILAQTHEELEVIVVDDGSTDRTAERVRELDDARVRMIGDARTLGISHRLNEGVRAARGRWIARMDGDDLAFPERLAVQLAYLARHPEVTLVGAGVVFFDQRRTPLGVSIPPESHEALVRNLASGIPLPHPTWLARAEWLRKFPYDPAAAGSEDQELLYRARRHGRYAAVPRVLLAYREVRTFRKVLWRRWNGARALTRTLGRDGDWGVAARLAALFALKAGADVVHRVAGARAASRALAPTPPAIAEQFRRLLADATALDVGAVVRGG